MDSIVMKKANELAGQATTLEDLNGVMRSLMKAALERMLNTELEVHLGRVSNPAVQEISSGPEEIDVPQRRNRKNGSSPKTIRGDLGVSVSVGDLSEQSSTMSVGRLNPPTHRQVDTSRGVKLNIR